MSDQGQQQPFDGVTLGEVNRAVDRIAKEVADLTKMVHEHALADAVRGEKLTRLEKIVYGALGVAGAALLTATITALLTLLGTSPK